MTIRLPKGFRDRKKVKIAVNFTPETFDKLLERCKNEQKPFSTVVEDVAKCGLLCLEESENDERLAS